MKVQEKERVVKLTLTNSEWIILRRIARGYPVSNGSLCEDERNVIGAILDSRLKINIRTSEKY